jgi:MSHA biogenesis protein MshI
MFDFKTPFKLLMRGPMKRRGSGELTAVSWSGGVLAFVRANLLADGSYQVSHFGIERQGSDSTEDFVRRLAGLGLKGKEVLVMLRPEQYQILQIDAPAVPPEELRSAARWQIKEMLEQHVDDITLDVMRVGDGKQQGAGHLFVVVAANAVVRSVLELGDAMHWTVPVIDVQDMAQRNLQSAQAKLDGRLDRANAALVLVDERQAVLTISANEELFYTRRLEIPEGFLTSAWGAGDAMATADSGGASEIHEYVPDYSVGGVSYGTDYSNTTAAASTTGGGSANAEKAQRFLVEVQRSLDVWDRTWSSHPLNGVRVYAGARSEELAKWLGGELGQSVQAMAVQALFPGSEGLAASDYALCWPLLGELMRSEDRNL